MNYIDMHVHLSLENTDDQIAAYVKKMRHDGMVAVLLISPPMSDPNALQRLLEVCRKHQGFFVPFARIELAHPELVDVQALFDAGCVGIKFINPYHDYDDECYFPIYAKAEELGMPILFHTGVIGLIRNAPETHGIRGVSTARVKPEYLDTVAHAFPDLILQGAHLGNPWYEIALEIMRYNRNLYWDICGSTLSKKMTADWWTRIQWERESRGQFLYATDEHPILPEAGTAAHYTTDTGTHIRFLDRIGWTEREKEGYFFRNALALLEGAYRKQGRPFPL
jgi:uncharacterized protein